MLIVSTNTIINMLALRVISIKCVTWLVDVELLVSDTRVPAVPGTKTVPSGMAGTRTVAGTYNRIGGYPPSPGNSSTAQWCGTEQTGMASRDILCRFRRNIRQHAVRRRMTTIQRYSANRARGQIFICISFIWIKGK